MLHAVLDLDFVFDFDAFPPKRMQAGAILQRNGTQPGRRSP
jgi:hypothetical protein